MGPGHVRLEVHTGEYVVVFPDGTTAITPGGGGGEAIVFAVTTHVVLRAAGQSPCVQYLTLATWQRTGTVARVTAVTGFGVAFQAADVGIADLTHQRQARSTHHLVEEVGEGGLQLSDFLAAIALLILPWLTLKRGDVRVQRRQAGKEDVGGVELNRSIRPVADFTTPRGACG
ncbi:hypothetical protein D3C84_829450 [compost metagenome]